MAGFTATSDAGLLEVAGLTAQQIGDLALAHHIAIHELTPRQASLEEAFMELTGKSVEYHGGTTIGEKSAA